MRVGIVIQSRMGSARLKGKVVEHIEGKPMLWHILERLKKVKHFNELIVATSVSVENREIMALAEACGIKCFAGSEEDVLDRFYQVAKEFHLEQIVRATGDNPLVDPEETDRLIDVHYKTDADYSSNKSEVNSGLPIGIGSEMFSFAALERSWLEGKNPDHREHVDEYILQNPDRFNIQILQAPECKRAPNLRLTVDTKEDMDFMRGIYERFYVPSNIVSVEQVIKYLIGADVE